METIDFDTLADPAYDPAPLAGHIFIGEREARLIERLTEMAIPQAESCFVLETEALRAEHLAVDDDDHDEDYCEKCGTRGELEHRAKACLSRINLAGNGATFSYREPWTEGERFSFGLSTADLTDPGFPDRLRARIEVAKAAHEAHRAARAAQDAQEAVRFARAAEALERAEYERLSAKYGQARP
jgi:hypothetical protein